MFGQGGMYSQSWSERWGRGHGWDEQAAWGKEQGAGSREQLEGVREWKLDVKARSPGTWGHRSSSLEAGAGADAGAGARARQAVGGSFSSVDLYMRVDRPGTNFSGKVLQRL